MGLPLPPRSACLGPLVPAWWKSSPARPRRQPNCGWGRCPTIQRYPGGGRGASCESGQFDRNREGSAPARVSRSANRGFEGLGRRSHELLIPLFRSPALRLGLVLPPTACAHILWAISQRYFDNTACLKCWSVIISFSDTLPRLWNLSMSSVTQTSDADLLELIEMLGPMGVRDIGRQLDVTATAYASGLVALLGSGVGPAPDHSGRSRSPQASLRVDPEGLAATGSNFTDLALVLWREIGSIDDFEVRRTILLRVVRHWLVHTPTRYKVARPSKK